MAKSDPKSVFVLKVPVTSNVEPWMEEELNKRYKVYTALYNMLRSIGLRSFYSFVRSNETVNAAVEWLKCERYIKWYEKQDAHEDSDTEEYNGRKSRMNELTDKFFKDLSEQAEDVKSSDPVKTSLSYLVKKRGYNELVTGIKNCTISTEEDLVKPGGKSKYEHCKFGEYGFSGLACRYSSIRDFHGISANSIGIASTHLMCVGQHVWQALSKLLEFDSFGRKVKIHRYEDNEVFDTIEIPNVTGNFNMTKFSFKDRYVKLQINCTRKESKKRWMEFRFDIDDKDVYKKLALERGEDKLRGIKLVRHLENGKHRYELQFTLEGVPPNMGRMLGEGNVGIDVGPSKIVVASKYGIEYFNLNGDVGNKNNMDVKTRAEYNRLGDDMLKFQNRNDKFQKLLSKSDLVNNPECYDENGAIRKGCRIVHTRNGMKYNGELRDCGRFIQKVRKMRGNILANYILTLGDTFKTENNPFAEWQEDGLGKSISNNAPSEIISMLKNKVRARGGKFWYVDTYSSCTQFDHTDGSFSKMELSERVKTLSNGRKVDRDANAAVNIMYIKDDECRGKSQKAGDKKLKFKSKDPSIFDTDGIAEYMSGEIKGLYVD